jgi:uncharacterized protein
MWRKGSEGFFFDPSPYGFAVKTKSFKAYDADEWLAFYFAGLDYGYAGAQRR